MKQRIKSVRWGARQRKTFRKIKKRIKRLKRNEEVLRELQDKMRHNNISIIGIPVGEEKEEKIEHLFEKMMENFPNFKREKN